MSGSPLKNFLIGAACGLCFAYGIVFQIQSTEAFFLGQANNSYIPSLSVLQQPYMLITGNVSVALVTAFLIAWISEIVFLIVGGYEEYHESVKKHRPRFARIAFVALWVIVILDGLTDYNWGATSVGPVGRLFFTIVINFSVLVLGHFAWHKIAEALDGIKQPCAA